ncbi:ABC transporter permease [Paracoccus litorisediminis]|uniref:ABC transporter permease subunit n=1 Tax=Paracoccus litorisediminis TaxID=2006130 RepID=A0A844HSD2_9RHOB|nr:ABC transporter permease [Paracoccus litorisediminis]MTH62069.1 ABC transporter permease subunit [Paracoccus litorisediminis]
MNARARLIALTRKETRQMLRDRSNLIVGLVLPVVLILLFGFGLSFDVTDVRIAVVIEDSSAATMTAVAGIAGSDYFSPIWTHSMPEAEALIRAGRADAILRVPAEFTRDLLQGEGQLQLILNGVDSNTAQAIETYASGAISTALQHISDRQGDPAATSASVTLVSRIWFNEANDSTWFLVPGLIVLVMTLIGAFLTSLLIAREWERGTLESLFVTPARPIEMVLSKLAPYLVIGAIDLVFCLLAARFVFDVPIRGSLWIIILSSLLYLLVSLALGLVISGVTRNQFAASQMALLTSFMPALMLSGFVFDLRNVPVVVQVISNLLPATHFMGLIKTLFMAGDDWPQILRANATLAAYALVLIAIARRTLTKTLD